MALRRILLISAATVGLVAIARPAHPGPIYGFRTGVAASSMAGDFDRIGSDTRLGFCECRWRASSRTSRRWESSCG